MKKTSPSAVELRHAVLLLDALVQPARLSAPAIYALATLLLRRQLVSLVVNPTERAAQDVLQALRRLRVELEKQNFRKPVAGMSRIRDALVTFWRFADKRTEHSSFRDQSAEDVCATDSDEPLARIWSRLAVASQRREASVELAFAANSSLSERTHAGDFAQRCEAAAPAWKRRVEFSVEQRAA